MSIPALWYGSMCYTCLFANPFQLVGIATGLQHLHSYKPDPTYHGDLKGVCLFNVTSTWFADISVLQLNVLISDDGCPLLADFGFAFIINSSFSMDVERSGGGTPYWIAPEYVDP